MNLDLTDEQRMLRETVSAYLADRYGFSARATAARSDAGWSPDLWRGFAQELGILGAPFAEGLGGFGGGAIENMIVMEALGGALAAEPYLGTVVVAGGFLKHGGHPRASDWIARVVAGDVVCAFAHAELQGRYNLADLTTTARKQDGGWVLDGRKVVVVGAPWATHLVVTARTAGGQRDEKGVSAFMVDKAATGIRTIDYATIDGYRASDILFEKAFVPADALISGEDNALPLVERVVDEAIAASAAEACGVMERLHSDTVDYTKQRHQFGVPIASFQVLQHRMVDMFIHLERARSMTAMATLALDAEPLERAKAVSAAKVQVGQACRFVGQGAVQLHGGIGTTDELALTHYFKRATVLESAFGSIDHHLARFEALSFGEMP